MEYRPQSPDLSSYVPQSPDLSGLRPQSPDLSNLHSSKQFGGTFSQQHYQPGSFGGAFSGNSFSGAALSYSPTSVPMPQHQNSQYDYSYQQSIMPARGIKFEEEHDYIPDAPTAKRPRKGPTPTMHASGNGIQYARHDPTLGVELKTSFPVARIKRIMQADEDIGKVAQVTPHVVSRALELFMIRLISASAQQAKGIGAAGGGGKGPKKIQAQHMKKAILADENFDFLSEIAGKVPDAPTKAAKKEKDEGSDSEDVKPKRKGTSRKRKDSGDDF
jgi:Dr1-associated corepressor